MKYLLISLIKAYSFLISPLLGRNCRFHPTCSSYAVQAIDRHGVVKGILLAIRRILRCHPWYRGEMLDEVPESVAWGSLFGYKRNHSTKVHNK